MLCKKVDGVLLSTYKTSADNSEYPSENPPENISGTEYDIAHVQWGGTWRMPTREEQKELVEQCEWEKDTYIGKTSIDKGLSYIRES